MGTFPSSSAKKPELQEAVDGKKGVQVRPFQLCLLPWDIGQDLELFLICKNCCIGLIPGEHVSTGPSTRHGRSSQVPVLFHFRS